MKRILYIANFTPGRGGISGQVECLVRNLSQEDRFSVDVFSTTGGLLRRVLCFFALLRRARRYDVLHIHGCSYRGFLPVIYGVIVGKIWGQRIMVTYHGGGAQAFFSQHPRWVRFWLMKADKRVVLSGFLKTVFDKYEMPSVVIPNIVDLRNDVYTEKEKILPKFISVRHLRELYNIPCILKAFGLVQQRFPESELVLLGDGDRRKELESYVAEHDLRNVRFMGQVPNEIIGEYLQKSDIMLSAPKEDNMPVSLLEAFSAGLLVISSNVGGVPYILEHGRTGLLFESDNDSDLAKQMFWALSHQSESLQMIRNAKEDVQKYSIDNIREQIVALYE